jgi:hypothetical protein
MTDNQIAAAKCAAAWGACGFAKLLQAIGVTSWGDGAAMLAALYSLILICEWAWKKLKAWLGKE